MKLPLLKVLFNGHQIKHNEKILLHSVQNQPKIIFNFPAHQLYTIMMIDPDAPSKDKPINKYWLHWLMINNDQTILDFNPPAPPIGSGEHRYYIYVFQQPQQIKLDIAHQRPKFNFDKFVQTHQLKPIAVVMFRTERKE
jgi:phosphatidylethanolamine-binding protein